MQHRWEDMLIKAGTEKDKIAAQSAAQSASSASAPTAAYATDSYPVDAYPVDPNVRRGGSVPVAPAGGTGAATSRPRIPRP
jgi:hypothetical protein